MKEQIETEINDLLYLLTSRSNIPNLGELKNTEKEDLIKLGQLLNQFKNFYE